MSGSERDYSFDYIRTLYDEAGRSHTELAGHAEALDLEQYVGLINLDKRQHQVSTVKLYFETIDDGVIDDQELAYELAVAEEPYQMARKETCGLELSSIVLKSVISGIETQSNQEQHNIIADYLVRGRHAHATVEDVPVDLKSFELKALTDEQIRAAFDTRPIERDDFVLIVGTNKSTVTRCWEGLSSLFIEGNTVPTDKGSQIAPTLTFAQHPERDRAHHGSKYGDKVSGLDFVSYYNYMLWVQENMPIKPGKDFYYRAFGPNVGKTSFDAYYKLIAVRLK